jgi:hypothetical protein
MFVAPTQTALMLTLKLDHIVNVRLDFMAGRQTAVKVVHQMMNVDIQQYVIKVMFV